MKRWLSISLSTLAITPIIISISQPAQAFDFVRRFTSFLDASQEVTPSTSTATGTATLDVLQDGFGNYALEYEVIVTPELDFTALRDETDPIKDNDIIFFHLHADAPRGANGQLPFRIKELQPDGVVRNDDDFRINITNENTVITGLLTEGEFFAPPDAPQDPFTDFNSFIENELLSIHGGDTSLYWNIHSFAFPSGAIRGQVVATPEPTSLIGLLTLGFLGVSCVKNKHKSH